MLSNKSGRTSRKGVRKIGFEVRAIKKSSSKSEFEDTIFVKLAARAKNFLRWLVRVQKNKLQE